MKILKANLCLILEEIQKSWHPGSSKSTVGIYWSQASDWRLSLVSGCVRNEVSIGFDPRDGLVISDAWQTNSEVVKCWEWSDLPHGPWSTRHVLEFFESSGKEHLSPISNCGGDRLSAEPIVGVETAKRHKMGCEQSRWHPSSQPRQKKRQNWLDSKSPSVRRTTAYTGVWALKKTKTRFWWNTCLSCNMVFEFIWFQVQSGFRSATISMLKSLLWWDELYCHGTQCCKLNAKRYGDLAKEAFYGLEVNNDLVSNWWVSYLCFVLFCLLCCVFCCFVSLRQVLFHRQNEIQTVLQVLS